MIKFNSEQLFRDYFPDFTDEQISLLIKAGNLYKTWNEKINVISRKDIEEVYIRHILHSLAIAKFISFKKDTSILDIGTGGGFPGIPLAIAFPESRFHLIDSIGKKITVVTEIAQELKLNNVKAEQKRAERIREKYDFVTCRAVSRLSTLLPWIEHNVERKSFNTLKNGLLTLKGGDLTSEIKEIKRETYSFSISEVYNESFFETKQLIHIPL